MKRPEICNYESRDGEVFETDYDGFILDWNEYADHLEEENQKLNSALVTLMDGVDELPPLTVIAGVLEDQWELCINTLNKIGKPYNYKKELTNE